MRRRPSPKPPLPAYPWPRSIRVFVEDRLDRAFPRPMVFFQKLFGRSDAACDALLERPKVTRLVATVLIELLAASQSFFGKRQCLLGNLKQGAAADRRLEAERRHVVAQLLTLCRSPVLHDLPAGVEV